MHLNHTIVPARDKIAASDFVSQLLGLPPPRLVGPFAIVQVDADLSLDLLDAAEPLPSQHYAFLVSEAEFDAIFARMRERGLTWWADPSRREVGQLNTWDGGRGVYFEDPNGHLLEVITRPYGSGGTTTRSPHPLFNPPPV